MSRDARLEHDFADGRYTFRLGWGELEMLQEARDAGPYAILSRMQLGDWLVQDISHIIRIGLIGGGMAPVPAKRLVESYVESRPPAENLILAVAVLSAGCVGAPDEVVGKPVAADPAESASTTSQTEN